MKASGNKKKLFKNMSVITLITILFSFSQGIFAQSKEEVFVVADEMPVYPGGTKALMEFLYSNITYPADAKANGVQGKVIVRFVIDKEGKAIEPVIAKGLSPSIDESVLDIIPKIPRFTPGKNAGKTVSVWYALPITFKLIE